MKNEQRKKAPLSLEEQYKSIFPDIYTDDSEDQNEEFWLAQPPAQKFVNSTTTYRAPASSNNHRIIFRAQEARELTTVRHNYLASLHKKTGRNIIAYYSGWLSRPDNYLNALNDKDKNGFVTAVHKLDRSKGLDLFLHASGGSISAMQTLVHYLQTIFKKDIRAVVPQIAMSAGTMIACSCKEILMGNHSNLGPIDPQLSGVSANAVIEEFKRVYKEIKLPNGRIDKAKAAVWQPIISKYRPAFLTQCQQAIDSSNQFVEEQLATVMFQGMKTARAKAKATVKELCQDGYDMHYHIDECKKMGLKIEPLEADNELHDLVLTVHHCYMHTLMNTPTYKIIENHNGIITASEC